MTTPYARPRPRSRPLAARLVAPPVAALVVATAPGAATTLAGQDAESATFVLTQNGTRIATETFERAGDTLETTLTIINQATLRTRGTLRDDATLARLEVRVFGPGGTAGEPVQTSAVTFDGGTVAFEQPIGTPTGEPGAVDPGAVPYLNPSPTYMEQILRRARAMGGDSVRVPVWTPAPNGGQVTGAAVVFGADGAASLTLGGVTIEAVTDAVGRLLSARVPTQGLEIERE